MSESRRVPFFNYPALFTSHEDDYMEVMRGVLRRGAYIRQAECASLEANVAKFLGVKHAIGVGNCTDGLTLALICSGVKPGDEVIFPSHTFVATASAIKIIGAVPVPADIGPDHLIDPDSIEAAITPKTTCIMPVQLNGRTADMDRIMDIAERHGLMVVEDAAQSLGSTFRGKRAGSFGRAAAYSFYPAKLLGAFGDAGLVVTNDDAIAQKVRQMADHGRSATGEVEFWGMNSRLDNLHAGVLDYQFSFYDKTMARRRELAGMYQAGLGDMKELLLPPGPTTEGDHYDVYQNYEIESDRRDELKAFLGDNGIGTAIQWAGKGVHQMTALGFTQRLPATERMFERSLLLPLTPFLADEDVAWVINRIRAFHGA